MDYFEHLKNIVEDLTTKGQTTYWPDVRSGFFPDTQQRSSKDIYAEWRNGEEHRLANYHEAVLSNCYVLAVKASELVYWSKNDADVLKMLSGMTIATFNSIFQDSKWDIILSLCFQGHKCNSVYQSLLKKIIYYKTNRGNGTISGAAFSRAIDETVNPATTPGTTNRINNRIELLNFRVENDFIRTIGSDFCDTSHWYMDAAEKKAVEREITYGLPWKEAYRKVARKNSEEALKLLRNLSDIEMYSLAEAPWSVFLSFFDNKADADNAYRIMVSEAGPSFTSARVRAALEVINKYLVTLKGINLEGIEKLINLKPKELSDKFDFWKTGLSQLVPMFGTMSVYNEYKRCFPEFFDVGFYGHNVIAIPFDIKMSLIKFYNDYIQNTSKARFFASPHLTDEEKHKQKVDVLLNLESSVFISLVNPARRNEARNKYVWSDTFKSQELWASFVAQYPGVIQDGNCIDSEKLKQLFKKFVGVDPLEPGERIQSREDWIKQQLKRHELPPRPCLIDEKW